MSDRFKRSVADPSSFRNSKKVAIICALMLAFGSVLKAQTPTLYVVGNSHFDTQWLWDVASSINGGVKTTMLGNFDLFDKYPSYKFSFEGAIKYQFMKEYYPKDYDRLKSYVQQGRWSVAGSWVDAVDVNMPSPEALIRHALLGNGYFKREFGKTSIDVMLPDCFGFGYALPTIAVHCGLRGFHTQKLGWGSSVEVPFSIGNWKGVDGNSLIAVLQPGDYGTKLTSDISADKDVLNKINTLGTKTGLYFGYQYIGVGDGGGFLDTGTISWLQKSIQNPTGPIVVKSVSSDQLFRDFTDDMKNKLQVYDGELLLTTHGTGCYTSVTPMKKWNRFNQSLADATERAAVFADWLGGASYPRKQLNEAWTRFLWHQFHDDLTGTSIVEAYDFSINDEAIAANQFGSILGNSAGAVCRAMNTSTVGVPVVVYNPLTIDRTDPVDAMVTFENDAPANVTVIGPDGTAVPVQVISRNGKAARLLFLAKVPPVGFSVYDVRPTQTQVTSQLSITASSLENAKYRVSIDPNGDISAIFDKQENRQVLSAPIRLAMLGDNSTNWPAWEVMYNDVAAAPRSYVNSPAVTEIMESGPARVSLKITRTSGVSLFVQYVRLYGAGAQDLVEVESDVKWRTKATMLKATFALNVSNPQATYDLGIGTIKRGNNTSNKYEVPAQQWADLTSSDDSYGATIINDNKHGWDKPSDNTLRLTLIHSASGDGYSYKDRDLGGHQFKYAVYGHSGSWSTAQSVNQGLRFNQPLYAFQTVRHAGILGTSYGLLSVGTPQLSVMGFKKAEESDRYIVRVRETQGRALSQGSIKFAVPITAVREVNGVEDSIGSITASGSELLIDMRPYQIRSFSVALAQAPTHLTLPLVSPVALTFSGDGFSRDSLRNDGKFGRSAFSIPAELTPDTVKYGDIPFVMGKGGSTDKNYLSANGQTISVDGSKYSQLYLMAARDTFLSPSNVVIESRIPNGFTGTYYDDTNFTNQKLVRKDAEINFNFGDKAPDPSMAYNFFSIRWQGTLSLTKNRTYTFHTISDDGVRVIIDNDTVINEWHLASGEEHIGAIDLMTGDHKVVVEYFEANPGAVIKCWWTYTPDTIVAAAQDTFKVDGTVVAVPKVNGFTGNVASFIPHEVLTRQPIGWVATHRHKSNGENDEYRFCYGFVYSISLPSNATQVTLPTDTTIKIFAMTAAQNINAFTMPISASFPVELTSATLRPELVSVRQRMNSPRKSEPKVSTPTKSGMHFNAGSFSTSINTVNPDVKQALRPATTVGLLGDVLDSRENAPTKVSDRELNAPITNNELINNQQIAPTSGKISSGNGSNQPSQILAERGLNILSAGGTIGVKGHGAIHAIDNDDHTRWTPIGKERNPYIICDLGRLCQVDKATISVYSRIATATEIAIDISADGKLYTRVGRGECKGAGFKTIDQQVSAVKARFVKLTFLLPSQKGNFSVIDVNFDGRDLTSVAGK